MKYYLEGKEDKPKQPKEKQLNTNQVIYLGELPPDLDQYELNQFILAQGKFNIESLLVKSVPGNKSFAYVKFKNRTEADKARKALHLKPFKNYVIKAEPFKSNEKNDKSKNEANIFIKNLPPETTPKDLYDLFASYGTIISIKLKQNDKGECLGYGYVNYELESSALNAIQSLNDKEYKERILSVSIFTPREKRIENNEYANPLLLVKNLPPEIEDDKQLLTIFESYGQILLSGIINEIQNARTGLIVFAKKENAESAVAALNNKQLPNTSTIVELSLSPFEQDLIDKVKKAKQESYKIKFDKCNLVVKNLPIEITDKHLFELFKPFGDISSARVATEGVMKEIKNDQGDIIDKEFVYQSKGYAFVLFKNTEAAQKALNALNDKEGEIKGIKYKMAIDYYDYSKGEKSKLNEIQMNMNMNMNQMQIQQKPKRQLNNNKPYRVNNDINNNNNNQNYQNNRGNYPQNNPNRQPNRFDNEMAKMQQPQQMYQQQQQQQQHHNQQYQQQQYQQQQQQQYHQNQQQQYQQQHLQQHQQMQQQQQYQHNVINEPKITVEGDNLVAKVKQILAIEDEEEKTESLGELLFYFLLKLIPQYGLNMTNGRVDDTSLCSKLTGILIKTDTKNLLEIISKTDKLCNSLRDVLLKLMQANRLEN